MAKSTIRATLQRAVQLHQAGRLSEADGLYRSILARDRNCIEALHYLGVIGLQTGQNKVAAEFIGQAAILAIGNAAIHANLGEAFRRLLLLDKAVESFRRALALQPRFPNALGNLGLALAAQGKFDDAIVCLRQAIALNPEFAEAYNNLGNILKDRGQFDEALTCFRRALLLQPQLAETHLNLGLVLKAQGREDEALACFHQALALKPTSAGAYNNLGLAFTECGQLGDAVACYEHALAYQPDLAEAHNNLGVVRLLQSRFDEAAACFRQALTYKPDYAEALNHLGNVRYAQNRLDEAADWYRQSLAVRPDNAEAHSNLGSVLNQRREFDEAAACFRRAIVLKPDFAEAHNNLAGAANNRGLLEEALDSYRRALMLEPTRPDLHSNLILVLNYHSSSEAGSTEAELRRWNEQYAWPLAKFIQPHNNDRTTDRRLRIGYVSPDFRMHSVAFFLLPLLESHNRTQFHITCYWSNASPPDSITARFQACADAWRSLVGLSDEAGAQRIRDDKIDVLVDLSGHTAGNRLPLFARKPAPIQVSYLGYPGNTGLDTIGYRLTDVWADPPGGTDDWYAEELIRLPDTAWCFTPLSGSPPLSPPPYLRHGHVTFGCFNNFAKVTPEILQLWARVLQRLPGSRLALKNQAVTTPSAAQRLRVFFADRGISADRLELIPHQDTTIAHLQCHDRVDLMLDTFPYHGTTTTCEALWMGVPVLTLAGKCHVSRVGVSLLTNVGLPEFVAHNPDDYVKASVAAASNLPKLSALRGSLRESMQRSPLMDAPRLARAIEQAYRTMWHRWCAEPAPLVVLPK